MTTKFFSWAVFAAKPLRLLEWHHIIAWIRDNPPTSLQEWRDSNYYTETADQLERQIRSISRGLVEVKSQQTQVDFGDRNSTVAKPAHSIATKEKQEWFVSFMAR
ncbi:uncharacterized protein BDV14DRAFT_167601 [Aspergillus stella-maris]|uniref:uncharacterized protein n=1 Tax=Aspergillus stella-maris TaxID=1810926 RepID=UPI003CCD7820